jgi:hypothetical protein
MPDAAIRFGFLFVLAVPVEGSVDVQDRSAVGWMRLPFVSSHTWPGLIDLFSITPTLLANARR